MDREVAPVDQRYPLAEVEVNVTDCTDQHFGGGCRRQKRKENFTDLRRWIKIERLRTLVQGHND